LDRRSYDIGNYIYLISKVLYKRRTLNLFVRHSNTQSISQQNFRQGKKKIDGMTGT